MNVCRLTSLSDRSLSCSRRPLDGIAPVVITFMVAFANFLDVLLAIVFTSLLRRVTTGLSNIGGFRSDELQKAVNPSDYCSAACCGSTALIAHAFVGLVPYSF